MDDKIRKMVDMAQKRTKSINNAHHLAIKKAKNEKKNNRGHWCRGKMSDSVKGDDQNRISKKIIEIFFMR